MLSIEDAHGQLHYAKFGNGPTPLLTFHGFGQNKEIFESWKQYLGGKYTIYAFDLFYHGKSDRQYGKLTKKDWERYLTNFLEKEGIQDFAVLGYSLGGRFALASALSFPERTNELILVAPDGIFLTIWFYLATSPTIRWLFKYIMLNPGKLENLLQFNERTKLVNSYIADFVRKEMGNAENRKRVYISWNHFKSLGYSKGTLIRRFKKHQFKRRIILGSKDHIIKPSGIIPIIDKMGRFTIDVLPFKHHQLINKEVAKLIAKDSQ